MKVEKVDNEDAAFAFEPFSPSRIIIIASRSQTEVVTVVTSFGASSESQVQYD